MASFINYLYTFILLGNCSHYFCYPCIKIWRNSQDFSDINNHLKCPLCKTVNIFKY